MLSILEESAFTNQQLQEIQGKGEVLKREESKGREVTSHWPVASISRKFFWKKSHKRRASVGRMLSSFRRLCSFLPSFANNEEFERAKDGLRPRREGGGKSLRPYTAEAKPSLTSSPRLATNFEKQVFRDRTQTRDEKKGLD